MRNPPRDVMLSHAAKEMGYGWAFGVHEALDQSGALFGPLVVAAVLALRGEYRIAFAVLLIPALVTLSILIVARLTYPRPQEMDATPPDVKASGLPRVFECISWGRYWSRPGSPTSRSSPTTSRKRPPCQVR